MRFRLHILPSLIVALSIAAAGSLHAATGHDEALASAIELYTERGDAEAKAAFEAILADDPQVHEAHYYLARLAKRQRDWTTVAEHLETAIRIDPDNAIYWGDLAEAYGGQARKAPPLSQLGLARKTREALKKAVELAPKDLAIRSGLIEFYRQAPWIVGGGMDKAFAEAEIVRSQDPFLGAMIVGGLQQHEKKWNAAESSYREALKLHPGSTEAAYALAQLFSFTDRLDEAASMFEDILQRNPDHFASLYQVGRVAALSGKRLERGEAALRQYIASPLRAGRLPSHANAWHRLGNVLEQKGDKAGARDAYTKALELDPQLKDAADSLKKLR